MTLRAAQENARRSGGPGSGTVLDLRELIDETQPDRPGTVRLLRRVVPR